MKDFYRRISFLRKGVRKLDIERINNHTIKFFIPFQDIEMRGFSKDEILFQPSRGEELFWEIMEEVDQMSEVELESPLWIQVHVTDLGLEVMAMGAKETYDSKDEEDLADTQDGFFEVPIFEKLEKMLEYIEEETKIQLRSPKKVTQTVEKMEEKPKEDKIFLYYFTSFEDVIQLCRYADRFTGVKGLYYFEDKYYLAISFPLEDSYEQENLRSLLAEFATRSKISYVRLQTYGKCIGTKDGLRKIQSAFFSS